MRSLSPGNGPFTMIGDSDAFARAQRVPATPLRGPRAAP